MVPNCNRCNVGKKCRGAANFKIMVNCKRFVPPREVWKLGELALAHPTSLNGALSALPFETNFYRSMGGR
jgi:hypothetical protein